MTRIENRAWRLSKVAVLGLLALELAACGPEMTGAARSAEESGDADPASLDDSQSPLNQEADDGDSTWGPPPPPTGCGRMYAGQGLAPGQGVVSCDGRFWFVQQGDGNLVLYQGARPLWSSRTAGYAIAGAVMQGDGNFVLYTAHPIPIWNSRTNGYPGAYLSVQNDGNVVIRTSRGGAIWNTGTGGH